MYYISVCKNTVLQNLKRGRNEPVIRISKGKHGKPWRANTVAVTRGVIRYNPTHPMPM